MLPYTLTFFCLLGALAAKSGKYYADTFTFIHTNDVHAHLDQFNKYGTDCSEDDIKANKCYGGVARIKTVVDRIRKKNPEAFLFDAGDQFQGTMFYTYYKGNVTAKVMNQMKYDLMTIGNHEFDDGPNHLAKFAKKLDFPVVSANMDLRKNPALRKVVQPYKLFPKKKLAVIGFITNTTGFISSAGPTVKFRDAVPVVQYYVNKIRRKGYKKIIAVSHNGYEEDMDVARRTSGLDLIVGGHSHTYLSADPKDPDSKGLYPTKIKNLEGEPTYVVQAYCWGKYVGHLDVDFDRRGVISSISGAPILLNQNVTQNKVIKKEIKKWRAVFDEFGKVVVGQANAAFSTSDCQGGECDIGNLITDAMVESRAGSKVRAAFTNSGGIRAGFSAGPVKQSDVSTMLPFGNALVDLQLKGKQIRELFENVLAKKNQANGKPVTSFIQISGLKVKYNPKNENWKKVVKLEIAGPNGYEEVKDDAEYSVVTIDFIVNGGDSFFATPPAKVIGLLGIDEAVKNYIQKHSPIDVSSKKERIQVAE